MNEKGYTLAGVLTLIAVMSIFMAMAAPLWTYLKQRDNEEELIFRGREYMEAVGRYQKKFNAFPPDLETLLKLKMIRKLYKDPMTKSGEWKVLHPESLVQTGQAGAVNTPGTQSQSQPFGLPTQSQSTQDRGSQDQDNTGNQTEPGLESDANDKNSDEEPEVKSVGAVVGVVSRSKKKSFRIFNGQTTYNKWLFVYAAQQQGNPQTPAGQKPGAKQPKGQQNPSPQQQPPNMQLNN